MAQLLAVLLQLDPDLEMPDYFHIDRVHRQGQCSRKLCLDRGEGDWFSGAMRDPDRNYALSAEEIQASNFKNIVDIQKTAPGLFMETMNNENARTVLMPRFGLWLRRDKPLATPSRFQFFVNLRRRFGAGLHATRITQVERVEVAH